MIFPKIIGLYELGYTSTTTTITTAADQSSSSSSSSSSPSTISTSPNPSSSSSSNKQGPMTPRTLFSKRERFVNSSSPSSSSSPAVPSPYIMEDKLYLYVLCRGCKMCSYNKKFQHYMTIKKHLKKKKSFFSF